MLVELEFFPRLEWLPINWRRKSEWQVRANASEGDLNYVFMEWRLFSYEFLEWMPNLNHANFVSEV